MKVSTSPITPFGETILEIEVPSNLTFKAPLIFRLVNELATRGCIREEGKDQAELCFDEAITNAMVHGNRRDPSKKLRLSVFADAERWGVLLEDDGEGFDPRALPSPDSEESLMRESGRGILLMNHYLEELTFSERGNRVRMVGRRQGEAKVAARSAVVPAPPPEVTFKVPQTVGETTSCGPARYYLDEGIVVVEVAASKLTDENLGALKEAIEEALGKSKQLVVDLGAVAYLSSVVIGAFVGYLKRMRAEGGSLRLCALTPPVLDVFRISRMDRVFDLTGDRRTAIDALRGGSRRFDRPAKP
jgi:serine/threonine-protein kinase RsbW